MIVYKGKFQLCSHGGRGVCSRGGRRVWRSSISHLAHNHGLLFILLCLLSERQQTEVSAIASGYIPEYHTVGIAPDTKYTNKSFFTLTFSLTSKWSGPARVETLHSLCCLGLALGFLLSSPLQLPLVHSGNNVVKRVQQNLTRKQCQLLVTGKLYPTSAM